MKIGLYIGRFQPFHNGHLSIIQQMSKEMDLSFIIIGSADKFEENRNPFTCKQRIGMVETVLTNRKINNVKIAGGVEDQTSDRTWFAYTMAIFGSGALRYVEKLNFKDVYVYTRNPTVDALFKERGFKIKSPKPFKPAKGEKMLSATYIRECIKYDNDEWVRMVPGEVQYYLYDISGLATIKRVS